VVSGQRNLLMLGRRAGEHDAEPDEEKQTVERDEKQQAELFHPD
jgi:hypothetical protein